MSSVNANASTLQFLGAAGTVTGSKHLIRWQGKEVLLDCGLFQGIKQLRERNWAKLPVPPNLIDAVVISHAHIDHVGYLPLIVREGYRGPIYCTPATADLLPILLLDSARLQEEDADRANRHGYSKHKPAMPLYTTIDAQHVFKLVKTADYGKTFTILPGLTGLYRHAGHILGSATVEVQFENPGRKLVFSGDLGRWDRPILADPDPVPEADVLVMESTYGDRVHAPDPINELAQVVNDASARGGALIIPAFAIGRTQELIWALRQLENQGRVPILPVYIDSPMAVEVSAAYCKFPEDHDLKVSDLADPDRCPLRCHRQEWIRTTEESKAINNKTGPMIIISASGMATGGRVLHHLAQRLSDPRTTVLLASFQAEGTRGRDLEQGKKFIRIHGRDVPVKADIRKLDGFSAHADREEILRWLAGFRKPPGMCYLVHGESGPATSLAQTIREKLGWNVRPAVDGEIVAI